jgi:hypothetical protein
MADNQVNGGCRRLEANEFLGDIQFCDPGLSAKAGEFLVPGMLVQVTSTVDHREAVSQSYAIAYLHRASDESAVENGSAPTATDVQDGATGGTVTVKYEWDDLKINQAGEYFYRVIIMSMVPGEMMGFGTWDSKNITVSE